MATPKSVSYEGLQVKDGENESVEELRRLDFQRHERLHLIPTIDNEVREALKLLKEPEYVVDEDASMRRDRLADLIFRSKAHRAVFESSIYYKAPEKPLGGKEGQEEEEEDFYTPASQHLISARKFLIKYSLDESRKRLSREAFKAESFNIVQEIGQRRQYASSAKTIVLSGSQVVSHRPVSQVAISPNEAYVVAASWAGDIALLDTQSLEVLHTRQSAVAGKAGGVDWSSTRDLIVAGGEDGLVKVFAVDSNQLYETSTYSGHEHRVTGAKFHPSGNYIATSSFDTTWRLWDVETCEELLLQEGHSKEVNCLAFQCDGSLLCSAGLDSTGLIWDLRSGKRTMVLSGHARPIYSVDWSPNGYQVVTGSADGTIKVWDLRKAEQSETIMAHNSIVTKVRFDKGGRCLVSSGYDKAINLYSADNWVKMAMLRGHMDKILCVDIAEGATSIVSSGWDRSVKLWNMGN